MLSKRPISGFGLANSGAGAIRFILPNVGGEGREPVAGSRTSPPPCSTIVYLWCHQMRNLVTKNQITPTITSVMPTPLGLGFSPCAEQEAISHIVPIQKNREENIM